MRPISSQKLWAEIRELSLFELFFWLPVTAAVMCGIALLCWKDEKLKRK